MEWKAPNRCVETAVSEARQLIIFRLSWQMALDPSATPLINLPSQEYETRLLPSWIQTRIPVTTVGCAS
jgi:hypothetical protein